MALVWIRGWASVLAAARARADGAGRGGAVGLAWPYVPDGSCSPASSSNLLGRYTQPITTLSDPASGPTNFCFRALRWIVGLVGMGIGVA